MNEGTKKEKQVQTKLRKSSYYSARWRTRLCVRGRKRAHAMCWHRKIEYEKKTQEHAQEILGLITCDIAFLAFIRLPKKMEMFKTSITL